MTARRIVFYSGLGFVILLAAQLSARAQYFRDDFDGTTVVTDNGIEVNWVPLKPYEAGERRVEDGAYVLEPGSEPNQDTFSESDSFVENVSVANASLRTRVTTTGSDYFWGIFARSLLDENDRTVGGIYGLISEEGGISIGADDETQGYLRSWPSSTSLIPHETPVEMQLDFLGNTASLTVWAVGTDKPEIPQIQVNDLPDFLTGEGKVGVWAARRIDAGPMAAAFDYFEVSRIPEPTSFSLVLLSIGALAIRRL